MNATAAPAKMDSPESGRVKVVDARVMALPARLKLLAIPLVVPLCWWLVLGGIAAFHANLTTINLIQLRRCDRITRIRTDDPSTNKAEVIAVWNDKWTDLDAPQSVTINNLSASDVTAGQEWLVPLTFLGDGQREITTFKLGSDGPDGKAVESPPYVYPADEQSTELLNEALRKLAAPVKK